MIDIHCHIMPGVDDGSSDFAESISMGETAAACGVTDIIVTPHCNIPASYGNYYGKEYEAAFADLRALFAERGIAVKLHRGMEVFGTDDLGMLYDNRRVITLAGSRYMLVEFDFHDDAWRVRDVLVQLLRRGVTPVIAHPERYDMVQYDLQFALDWVQMGCLLQINRTSLPGDLHNPSVAAASRLLELGAVHAIATDAHGIFTRTTELLDAYDTVAGIYSEEWAKILTDENPRRIIEDRRVRRLPERRDGWDFR